MCLRSKGQCVEFGPRKGWSRHAPLMPPDWFWPEIEKFAIAARSAASGDRASARDQLSRLRGDDAREWFLEHGAVAFDTRRRAFQTEERSRIISGRRPSLPQSLKLRVFKRDNYTCRYCGLPTIPDQSRKAVQSVVGKDVLPWGRTNAEREGIAVVARTECDHVRPLSVGGGNDESNLVTACPSCNYGKDRYTLTELGLDDPFLRPAAQTSWDGLMSLVPALKAQFLRMQRETDEQPPQRSQ